MKKTDNSAKKQTADSSGAGKNTKAKADHSGHRDRLRAKYAEHGIEALAQHEVIEMLLFNAIPYRNTNDIAKNLLDHFGSLSAVLDASVETLCESGLTRNQALFLKLIPDTARVYSIDKYENRDKVLDLENIGEYFIRKFIGIDDVEHVMLLLTDGKGKELFCGDIAEGDFSEANVSLRNIVKLALNYNAAAAVLAHNHPKGFALPSEADISATMSIQRALANVGVTLIDHFVVADNDAVSIAVALDLD